VAGYTPVLYWNGDYRSQHKHNMNSSLRRIAVTLSGLLAAFSAIAQPANDNFANAWVLSGAVVTTNGTTAQATKEPGEPNHAGNAGARSVWFTWTAPKSAQVRMDTIGSTGGFNNDTLLAVYTGDAVNALTAVASNDNGPGLANGWSQLDFQATQGVTYHIAIDDNRFFPQFTPAGGPYFLHITTLASIVMTTPTNNQNFAVGTPIEVDVTADVPNPPVARMDFYRQGVLFATSTSEPFSAIASNAPAGSNSFQVVAVDNSGLNWTSAVARVAVLKDGITILSPQDGTTYSSNDPASVLTNPIPVFVYPSPANGSIVSVEFFADGQKFGQADSAPFVQSWATPTPGSHRLSAIGHSDIGGTYTSQGVNIGLPQLLLSRGSAWKYLDDGSNQGTNWVTPSYDDSAWSVGNAEFGYGDGDETTVIRSNRLDGTRIITTYFRRTFNVSNVTSFAYFQMDVKRDDGAVVYLNGTEAARFNMPSGVITNGTTPPDASDDGTIFFPALIPASMLVEGLNYIAVEVHQSSVQSSDVSFDMDLAGIPTIIFNAPPLVALTNPTNDAVFVAPSSLTLEATASDVDGFVTKVEFMSDGLKIGQSTTAPYSIVWNNPPLGLHALTAVATDDQGGVQASSPVNVTLYDSIHTPFAKITLPANGTVVEGPTNIVVSAYASALDGGVTNVAFYSNGSLIGQDATGPFSINWDAPFGSNRLTAVAYGANGLRGTSIVSTITITIPPTNTVAPFVARQTPLAFANVTNVLTNIVIQFSERVSGVDASDLLIDGYPATGVSGSGSNYVFTFPQPPFGEVSIEFAADNGIFDFGWPSNLPFDLDGPNARWEYELIDKIAPKLTSHSPASGVTVTNLTQVAVTFSEDVTGVDAEDLLVNGTPAFGISGSGSNYVFSVSQPSSGTVSVTWATNHGITDVAEFPNAFAATSANAIWSFTLDSRIVLVQSNANWQLQKGTAEASSPTNAWRQQGFNEGWPLLPAPFFFGDTGYTNGLIPGTYLSDMRSNYSCIFVRTEFTVANAGSVESLLINAQFDDGFIAWINGNEVLRVNMPPTGEIPYNATATTSSTEPLGNGAAYVVYTLTNGPSYLVTGTNTLAVQVFNQSLVGSDFGWNAQLYAFLNDVGVRAPRIVQITPPSGTVFSLSNVTMRFSEPVTGVDASDLLVNGTPAASLTVVSNSIYTFNFSQPPFGPVDVTWATGTGILDQDALPKPFDGTAASAKAHYTLLNPSAPTVVTQAPPAFATITNLTAITVRFSEPVAGVDPSDLLINGTPASSVSLVNPTNYTFTFTKPPFGPVSVTWAKNNGIQDLENPPNDFDPTRPGGVWTYSLVDPVPSVVITAPANNAAFLVGTNITIQASASDNDGTVTKVEFYANGNKLGETAPAPYNFAWEDLQQGDYTLVAVATDNTGLRGTSAPVNITVVTSLPIALLRGPYLQVGTPTSGVIRWRTDLSSDGLVYYGTDPNALTNIATAADGTNEHIVQISGLAVDTKYYYSIGSSAQRLARGPDYWFKTSPVPGVRKPTRFWVLGDSGTGNENAEAVRDAYYRLATTNRPADFWLMLGDNAYNSGLDTEYQTAVFDMYPNTLRNLFLWPTIGNHETQQAFVAADFPYLHIFTLPQNGEAGGVPSGSPRYYSFDYANIHFICLDSMSSGRTTNTAMAQWLVSDLDSSRQEWTIVFFHHPAYTKGNHNSDTEAELIEIRQNILPILETHGVDLVLNGHSHSWERSYLLNGHYGLSTTLTSAMKVDGGSGREDGTGAYHKNALGQGVVYNVAGNGGQITGGSLNHPANFISLNELGSIVIDVNSNRLDAVMLATNGVYRDHYTLIKTAPPLAPINLVASPLDIDQISLSWTDSVSDRSGFKVERSLDGTNFVQAAFVSSNITSMVDTGLLVGTTYFYRVRAVNYAYQSDYSPIASASTVSATSPPRAPADLVASADNGTQFYRSQMILRWRDLSHNESGFVIERSADSSAFVQIGSVGANVSHFVDHGLQSATVYYYRVHAVNQYGSSANSNLAGEQTHPQDNLATLGSAATFHGGVEGQPGIRYQWRFNGALISGATNESYTVASVRGTNEGSYTVDLTDTTGTLTSNPAYLFVVAAPFVVTDPVSATNLPGTSLSFAVSVIGDDPLSYQWRRNGVVLPGESNSALNLNGVQRGNEGSYDVVVQNDFGSVTSRVAVLIVNSAPVALPDSLVRDQGAGFTVPGSALLANDSDPEGDSLLLTSVSPTSSHGATVSLSGGNVSYTPVAGYDGQDTFTYTISDNRGATASALVTVSLSANTLQIVSIQPMAQNQFNLTVNALANQPVTVLFAPVLGTNWTTITNYPAASSNRVLQVPVPKVGRAGSTDCSHLKIDSQPSGENG